MSGELTLTVVIGEGMEADNGRNVCGNAEDGVLTHLFLDAIPFLLFFFLDFFFGGDTYLGLVE
ncbi:MAG: hypothetical protein WCS07_11700, partial [Sphaerochaeta sp.]